MLARNYMFHNSKWVYRPLWTYEAEKRASNIIFYFYSTNSEPFKTNCGYQKQFNHWDLMSWPEYLVWDGYQKDWLIRSLGRSDINIRIVGPIWFSSNNKKSTALPLNTIAVFDIPVRRDCLNRSYAHFQNYWTPSIINQFLVDICHVFLDTKINIAYKQKRAIGDDIHKSYKKIINKIEINKEIIKIDPGSSAIDVISKSKYVISLPFTSTAIIGKNMGIESVYYDPTNTLQKDDRAAHGVPILSGIYELEQWATMLISEL
jgi:polysaccharide biosynthesis PFTS motif protein